MLFQYCTQARLGARRMPSLGSAHEPLSSGSSSRAASQAAMSRAACAVLASVLTGAPPAHPAHLEVLACLGQVERREVADRQVHPRVVVLEEGGKPEEAAGVVKGGPWPQGQHLGSGTRQCWRWAGRGVSRHGLRMEEPNNRHSLPRVIAIATACHGITRRTPGGAAHLPVPAATSNAFIWEASFPAVPGTAIAAALRAVQGGCGTMCFSMLISPPPLPPQDTHPP